MKKASTALWAFLVLVVTTTPAPAQNYRILDQRLDENRHGYTVIRVWGTHREMGLALGVALAEDIARGWQEIKGQLGDNYLPLRSAIAGTLWLPEGIEDEIAGVLAGVRSVTRVDMDGLDVKLMNTFSDWAYYGGCRSHSCWGSRVQAPVKTLSTRRLDYGTPFPMARHHVLCAWDPKGGSPRFVNLAWPGYVTVITAVNQYGTQSSLHDYGPGASFPADAVCRSVAARYILTGMGDAPSSQHLTWSQQWLSATNVACSSFLNYYQPEGRGGVFTCSRGGPCGALRLPQPDYFGGEVLVTTNTQTDGHSMPLDDGFMDPYYRQGGLKDLRSHFELMGTGGLHLMSVEYRGEEDMTIWVHGRGRADRIEVEWSDLFPGPGEPDAGEDGDAAADLAPDGGGADDAGGGDRGQSNDGGALADVDAPGKSGCGCRHSGGVCLGALLLPVAFVLAIRRGR